MNQLDVFDTTNELLDKYARKYDLATDYQIAKHLGCTTSTISNYRNRKTKMDPTTCVQIAEALQVDPMLIIAKIKMESQPTAREDVVWGKYAGRAYFLAAIVSTLLTGQNAEACADMGQIDQTSYTLCARLRRVLRKIQKHFSSKTAFFKVTSLPFFAGATACEPQQKRP